MRGSGMDEVGAGGVRRRPIRLIAMGIGALGAATLAATAGFIAMVWSVFEVMMLPF
jgi:hypothetical protein